MTDAERAAFANLILLCSAHHKLVDRDEPTYPVERLEEWKADNEDDDLAALAGASLKRGDPYRGARGPRRSPESGPRGAG